MKISRFLRIHIDSRLLRPYSDRQFQFLADLRADMKNSVRHFKAQQALDLLASILAGDRLLPLCGK